MAWKSRKGTFGFQWYRDTEIIFCLGGPSFFVCRIVIENQREEFCFIAKNVVHPNEISRGFSEGKEEDSKCLYSLDPPYSFFYFLVQ